MSISSYIPSLIGAFFGDISQPVINFTSTGGATLSAVMSEFFEQRKKNAREILLDEIRRGDVSPTKGDIDQSVAILYRYWRAAQEGAGRLNLRLLAAVYAGQVRDGNIVADDFLYYAELLASLRREEIILLGTFLRHSTNADGTPSFGVDALTPTLTELVPNIFETSEDCNAALGALQRTGLVAVRATGGAIGSSPGLAYQVTNLLRKLNRLAKIEGLVQRENDSATNHAPGERP